jgi:hypothetical protein
MTDDFRGWLTNVAAFTTTLFRDSDPDGEINRCIEWARTQTLVLDLLGVRARAVPVDVMAGNAKATAQLLDNRPFTDADEERGAWTVGVHHNQTHAGTGWNGHLVVVVPTRRRRILIDGTADQLSRPEHGIIIPSVLMMDLPAMWAGPIYTDPKRSTGIVRYMPMPPQSASARAWRDTNAWNSLMLPPMAKVIAEHLTPWVDVAV